MSFLAHDKLNINFIRSDMLLRKVNLYIKGNILYTTIF